MQIAEAFAAVIESLPEAVRRRLDDGETLDWEALESAGTREALGDAVRDRDRLPEPVETLVQRLVRDVGIVPRDVVRGVERQTAAGAWLDCVSVEPDGETYRIRNDRSGDVDHGISGETIAGYAILALELATAVHRARERWLDIGNRYRAAPANTLCPLARFSVRMSDGLRRPSENGAERPTTTELARILETAWNGQELPLRAELAGAVPSNGGPVVRAPRKCRLAPTTGYRLHACDPEEILWLCALAERAGLGAPGDEAEKPADMNPGAAFDAGGAEREGLGDVGAAAEPMEAEPAREPIPWREDRTRARDGESPDRERTNLPDAPAAGAASETDREPTTGPRAPAVGAASETGREPTTLPGAPLIVPVTETDREPENLPGAPLIVPATGTGREPANLPRAPVVGPATGNGREPENLPRAPAVGPATETGRERTNLLVAMEVGPATETGREPTNRPGGPAVGAATETDRVARPADEAVLLDMTALEERIGAEADRRLQLGTGPGRIVLDRQFDALEIAASRLPGPVRQRMTACYGLNAMQALMRLQDPHECHTLRAEVEAGERGGRAPRWLEELAGTLLIDAGAETQDGRRTAGLRLDTAEEPDARYLVTEMGTGAEGSLSLAGLLEQMHLSLAFAGIAWKAVTVLRNAGKEGGWALLEATNRNVEFSTHEAETLVAAQHIGEVLDRLLDTRFDADGSPSSLEQAAIAADALEEVGPTMRAAAGWPGALPNSGLPGDVVGMVDMAEALQADVRAISNRLIAGQMAGFTKSREMQGV